jgi:hypothetical protein
MKNFKLVFGLVFVILLGSVSCTEDQLDEDNSYEFKETQLQEVDPVVPTDSIPNNVDPKEVKKPD